MGLLGSVAAATAKETQAEWFSSDLSGTSNDGGTKTLLVHLSITTAVALAYTLNSGTTWVDFNEGAALVANSGYVFTIPVQGINTLQFNIRKSSSGNVTVNLCEVHLV